MDERPIILSANKVRNDLSVGSLAASAGTMFGGEEELDAVPHANRSDVAGRASGLRSLRAGEQTNFVQNRRLPLQEVSSGED